MKNFADFPGCSLEKMAQSYHLSALETTRALGVELLELEDWNCCGATAYFHVDELLAYTLCARNLAMAEKQGADLVAPCSGCYKNLYFTRAHLKKDADLAEHINHALQQDDLQFNGTTAVRHLLEVFVQDVGLKEIKAKVTHPLTGLRVAPYYGCQILRPRKDHEDVEQPRFFEDLLTAVGATPVRLPAQAPLLRRRLDHQQSPGRPQHGAQSVAERRRRRRGGHRHRLPVVPGQPRMLPQTGEPRIQHQFLDAGFVFHAAGRNGAGDSTQTPGDRN
ncbi:CoB--CoM heterodisulfide reductase iron-sulfur subunit B family protein [bacterium]|nr:CoB--CoM heterodisulfide reductase iron-sulfur subunit B family protein [bacterium]